MSGVYGWRDADARTDEHRGIVLEDVLRGRAVGRVDAEERCAARADDLAEGDLCNGHACNMGRWDMGRYACIS